MVRVANTPPTPFKRERERETERENTEEAERWIHIKKDIIKILTSAHRRWVCRKEGVSVPMLYEWWVDVDHRPFRTTTPHAPPLPSNAILLTVCIFLYYKYITSLPSLQSTQASSDTPAPERPGVPPGGRRGPYRARSSSSTFETVRPSWQCERSACSVPTSLKDETGLGQLGSARGAGCRALPALHYGSSPAVRHTSVDVCTPS